MFFIVILLMLIFEVVFNILIKYFRYNYDKFYLLIGLNIIYSSVWLRYLFKNSLADELALLYLIGIVQGLYSIFEIIKIQKKYKNKEYVRESLLNNSCRIVAFEWVEELTDEHIESVIKISNSIEGKNKMNTLVIAKEKDNKFKLMIFIYKENDNYDIKEKIKEYCDIDFIKENKRKQVIMCNLA